MGHALAVTSPRVAEQDPEELYNAAHAWMIAQGHGSALWSLQYRDFCGGCTLDAGLGAVLFSLLPPRWLVWKLVPLLGLLLFAGLGAQVLRRRQGDAAAWAFAALCLAPPRAWQHLSPIAWGNHAEAGLVGAIGLLALLSASAWGPLLAGLAGGLALAISFSGAWVPLALGGLLARDPRPHAIRNALLGFGLGLGPWAVRYLATGRHPFVTIYEEGEALPSLARIPEKLATLLAPGQLAALFGDPALPSLGPLFALLAAALLVWARQEPAVRAAGVGILGWLGVYLGVRFQVSDSDWSNPAVPQSMRYAAPLYPLLLIGIAAALGALWTRSRAAALGLGAVLLLPGALARSEALQHRYPLALLARANAVDARWSSRQLAYLLPGEAHAACVADDRWSRVVHGIALGRADEPKGPQPAPAGVDEGAWAWGLGEAAMERVDGPRRGELPELSAAQARIDDLLGENAVAGEALRAALTHRLDSTAAWTQWRQGHDEAALQRIAEALRGLNPALARAMAWTQGYAWARDRAGFADPQPIAWPAGLDQMPAPFLEGLGAGLGERWGPEAALPPLPSPALAQGRAWGARLAYD